MKHDSALKNPKNDSEMPTEKTRFLKTCLLFFTAQRKRLKVSFLALIVLGGVFASSGSLLLFSSNAYADANGVYVDKTILNDVKAYALRNAWAACSDWRTANVEADQVGSGHLYDEALIEDQVAVTAMNNSDDEQYSCSTPNFIDKAVKAFGWDSKIEAVCATKIFESKRQNGSDCVTGSGDFMTRSVSTSEIYKAIDDKRFGGNAHFSDAMYYILYARSMEIGCRATPTMLYDDANADQKAQADSADNQWSMKVVGSDGSVKKTIYKSREGDDGDDNYRDEPITTTVHYERLENITKTCIELANLANDYADAYAKYVKDHPPSEEDLEEEEEEAAEAPTTCAIDGIGWLICPVMTFLSFIVDAAYGMVSGLLTTPALDTDTGSTMYSAWSVMRNFANVAFVVAFIIIIYSQITSVGISNYGIKKMLPRLVIAAILVNVSYWLCAIAVDVSNILGSSLKGLVEGASNQIYTQGEVASDASTLWGGLTAAILAGGALMYIQLSALLPLLVAAIIAIVTVVLVLTLRQALIVLLIVISPLAFVAFLLPNTENLFDKWRKLFVTLLLMFPIIALIFGGSKLASDIINKVAGDDIVLQLMAAGITVLPLFITPVFMKAASGVLNRFAGIVNNPNKGPFDRLRKGAEQFKENRGQYRNLRAMNGKRVMPGVGFMARRRATREAVISNRQAELGRANASYVAGMAETNASTRAALSRGGGPGADMRALANAINVQAELETKEVKAASAVIEHMNLDSSQLNSLAQGNSVTKDGRTLIGSDDATRKAAIMNAISSGTVGDVEGVISSAGSMSSSQQKVLASAIASSGITKKATHLEGQSLDDIAQGKVTSEADLNSLVARSVNNGDYSAEKLADNSKASLERLEKVLAQPQQNNIGATKLAEVKAQADRALNDARISGRITDKQQPILARIKL